jgi:formiminotetrahydrofolate cyclodeaminase
MTTTEHLIADHTLGELLDSLAAHTPAPGGGTAAALAGAAGAGLVEMAARFTLGRDAYADRHARMAQIRKRAEQLRERLVALAQRELHAYEPVLAALALSDADPGRSGRVRDALSLAADSPLAVAVAAAEVAELGTELTVSGNQRVAGDAITGTLLAEAACRAAGRLVEINLGREPGDPRLSEAADLARRSAAARSRALDEDDG